MYLTINEVGRSSGTSYRVDISGGGTFYVLGDDSAGFI